MAGILAAPMALVAARRAGNEFAAISNEMAVFAHHLHLVAERSMQTRVVEGFANVVPVLGLGVRLDQQQGIPSGELVEPGLQDGRLAAVVDDVTGVAAAAPVPVVGAHRCSMGGVPRMATCGQMAMALRLQGELLRAALDRFISGRPCLETTIRGRQPPGCRPA